jgi:hypothetical protein
MSDHNRCARAFLQQALDLQDACDNHLVAAHIAYAIELVDIADAEPGSRTRSVKPVGLPSIQ